MTTPAGAAARRGHVQLSVSPLWAMARGAYLARCELRRRARVWELRVSIDDQLLLSRQCVTRLEADAVSNGWRGRLGAAGWSRPGEWIGVDPQEAGPDQPAQYVSEAAAAEWARAYSMKR